MKSVIFPYVVFCIQFLFIVLFIAGLKLWHLHNNLSENMKFWTNVRVTMKVCNIFLGLCVSIIGVSLFSCHFDDLLLFPEDGHSWKTIASCVIGLSVGVTALLYSITYSIYLPFISKSVFLEEVSDCSPSFLTGLLLFTRIRWCSQKL